MVQGPPKAQVRKESPSSQIETVIRPNFRFGGISMATAPSFVLPIPDKLFFDRRDVVAFTGLSLRFVDLLVADGTLGVKRIGARVLVPRAELLKFAGVSETSNKG
jgi:hypothetical protein